MGMVLQNEKCNEFKMKMKKKAFKCFFQARSFIRESCPLSVGTMACYFA